MIPTPAPGATPTPEPLETDPPAPELEALLPNDILGHRTQKVSMTAPKKLEYVFAVFDGFLACTNKQRTDLSLAIAIANDLRGWSVTAVRVDGVTGQEMADIFLYRMTNGPTGGLIEERAVDGRTYSLSEVGWAVYATDGTFYWIAQLPYGDFPPPTSPTCRRQRRSRHRAIIQLPSPSGTSPSITVPSKPGGPDMNHIRDESRSARNARSAGLCRTRKSASSSRTAG
jgi:hypothetical protein